VAGSPILMKRYDRPFRTSVPTSFWSGASGDSTVTGVVSGRSGMKRKMPCLSNWLPKSQSMTSTTAAEPSLLATSARVQ
jgi:hypothetical protein